jgi:hypothetical protein
LLRVISWIVFLSQPGRDPRITRTDTEPDGKCEMKNGKWKMIS